LAPRKRSILKRRLPEIAIKEYAVQELSIRKCAAFEAHVRERAVLEMWVVDANVLNPLRCIQLIRATPWLL
jgi:hypothetical protein